MPGALFAHPIAARRAVVHLRGDALENIFDVRPRGGRTAGHDARTVPRAFLAAAHAGADVQQPLALDIFRAAVGVFKQRIAAVNDDVARLQHRQQMLDEFVHRLAGLDHEHHAARLFEQRRPFPGANARR